MKTKLSTPVLALLLLAGASGAALAQDRDREHTQAAPHPQGAPHPGGPPGGAGRGGPPPGASQGHGSEGRGAQPQGGAPHQGFQGAPAGNPAQHFDRAPAPGGGPQGGGPRRFDHERGPNEVVPPGGGRGLEARPNGRTGGPQFDAQNSPWGGHGGHWQAGRAPPVFWSHDRFHAGFYRPPYGYYVRAWGFGDFLPRGWFAQPYWIGDFMNYDLPYPPPGYAWVRVGPDALMVDRFTGRIVQVVRGIFW
jgi:Ni/Co efflux regulator RcnB